MIKLKYCFILLTIVCSIFAANVEIFNNEMCIANCVFHHSEELPLSSSITTNSKVWAEIPFYTRTIELKDMGFLCITYRIPFVGNDQANSRSRIRLMFDGLEVANSMKYNTNQWELHDLVLTGTIYNIAKGSHTLKILAMVDNGTLNIPHFNPDLIENVSPPLSAHFTLFGSVSGRCACSDRDD